MLKFMVCAMRAQERERERAGLPMGPFPPSKSQGATQRDVQLQAQVYSVLGQAMWQDHRRFAIRRPDRQTHAARNVARG
jgi:hypothetical protein